MLVVNRKPSVTGCGVVFVPTLIVIDLVLVAIGLTVPYIPLAYSSSVGGFVAGATLGICLWVKTKPPTFWSRTYWLVFGLIGMCLPVLVGYVVVLAHHPH